MSPRALSILFFLFLSTIDLFVMQNVHDTAIEVADKQQKEYLVEIARTIAEGMSYDNQTKVMDAARLGIYGSLEEKIEEEKLKNFRINKKIRYISTLVEIDGLAYFLTDAETDSLDKSLIVRPLERYEEYPQNLAMIRAFKTKLPTVSKEIYEDRWGEFISAYAPLRNSDGLTIIVAIDVPAADFNSFHTDFNKSFRYTQILVVLLSVFMSLVLFWILEFARTLNAAKLDEAKKLLRRVNNENPQQVP